jgi:hypothetical protein
LTIFAQANFCCVVIFLLFRIASIEIADIPARTRQVRCAALCCTVLCCARSFPILLSVTQFPQTLSSPTLLSLVLPPSFVHLHCDAVFSQFDGRVQKNIFCTTCSPVCACLTAWCLTAQYPTHHFSCSLRTDAREGTGHGMT